jgi:hydrogenase maturation protein HypF
VQHHYAHILAAMVEHHLLDRTVLGVSWDGTGFGSDGTIWGGEFLICQAGQWSRVGNLRPFRLPGGEAAVLQPWRTAVELTIQATQTVKTVATDRFLDALRVASPIGSDRLDPILLLVDRPHLAPLTTSAGRLFDAASAMILRTHVAQFDGQPAMLLESAVDPSEMGAYPLPLCDSTDGTDTAIDQSSLTGGASIEGLRASSLWLDWRPLVRAILEDSAAHVAAGVMAMRFHRGVAQGIWQVCHRFPDLPVVLGGGVFQNRVLLELLAELVPRQRLFLPGTIPPNDGGLAAGQLAAAGHRIPEPAEGPAAICIT